MLVDIPRYTSTRGRNARKAQLGKSNGKLRP